MFFGMVISISRNVYQDQKVDRLASDLAALRQESRRDIAELRDSQSASLEQDLVRIDQLSSEVAKTNDDALRQATTLANKTKLDLARTVEQRHQEMLTAISDLRADLRSDVRARASDPVRDAPTARWDIQRARTDLAVANVAPAAKPSTPPATDSLVAAPEEPASAPSTKKKHFWDKLNPFNRKKQETAVSGAQ
jgi:hypothetical protein